MNVTRSKRIRLNLNLFSLLIFELSVKAGIVLILVTVGNAMLSLAMRFKGYSYITAANLGSFLLSPVTIILIVLFLILALALNLLELSGVFTNMEFSFRNRRIHPAQTLILGCVRAENVFLRAPFLSLSTAGLFTLAAYIPLFFVILYRNHLLLTFSSYLFQEKLVIGIAAVAAILAILIISAFVLYSVPILLFRDMNGRESLKRSVEMSRRQHLRIAASCASHTILNMGVLVAIYIVVLAGITYFMNLGEDYSILFARLLGISNWLILILCALSSVTCYLSASAELFRLYVEAERVLEYRSGIPVHTERPAFLIPRTVRIISSLLIALILTAETAAAYGSFRNSAFLSESPFTQVQVTAHRGDSITAPENTVTALEHAIENSADYAEIDIQMTSDDVLVLLHDISLERTTGVSEMVYNMTYAEISELDAGSFMGEEYAGEKIPTLIEVLELCKGRINLNIEIKSDKHYNGKIVPLVVGLIDYYEMQNQCVISSFSYNYLKEVKELDPEIRTGYIMKGGYGAYGKMEAADFVSVRYSYVSENMVNRAHEAGKEIWCWTVNTPPMVREMASMGVDNIITDDPSGVRTVLASEEDPPGYLELLRQMIRNE